MSNVIYAAVGAAAALCLLGLAALAVRECVSEYRQAGRTRRDREREQRIAAYTARLEALRRVSFRKMIEDWQDRPSLPSNDWRRL